MAAIKTKETLADVDAFLTAVQPEYRQKDCMTMLAMMKSITRQELITLSYKYMKEKYKK